METWYVQDWTDPNKVHGRYVFSVHIRKTPPNYTWFYQKWSNMILGMHLNGVRSILDLSDELPFKTFWSCKMLVEFHGYPALIL